MSIYRKNESGELIKTSGSVVQRWNDRIFLTEHTVADGKDYYEIEADASKYILALRDLTEYQLYIDETNTTDSIYITFKGQSLELRRTSLEPIAIGTLLGKLNCYTLYISTGHIWTNAEADMELIAAELPYKANLSGGNSFTGLQTYTNGLNIVKVNNDGVEIYSGVILLCKMNSDGIYINPAFISSAASGNHVPTKTMVDGYISTHNVSEVAHEYIRELIQALQQEVARLDGRGKSYGEISYTTAALEALSVGTRDTTITAAIVAGTGGATYTPSNGDLVYDTGVGLGVKYHEWEYNSTAVHWVDNGAINSPKASNSIFGTVKGDSTYVSIVSGLIQVLLADNATYIKKATTADKYTYEDINSAFADRYTKDQTDALLESLKLIQGVTEETLGNYVNTETIPFASIQDYDQILIHATNESGEFDQATIVLQVSALRSDDIFKLHFVNTNTDITFDSWTVACGANVEVFVYGLIYQDILAENVLVTHTGTNYLDESTTVKEDVEILDEQLKTAMSEISGVIDGTTKLPFGDGDLSYDEAIQNNIDDINVIKVGTKATDQRLLTVEETVRKNEESTEVATVVGSDILSMVKDVASGQMKVKLEGLSLQATQLLTSPDMNATTGWTTSNTTSFSVSNGIAEIVANGTALANITQASKLNLIDKFYTILRYKQTGNVATELRINFGNSGINYAHVTDYTIISRVGISSGMTNYILYITNAGLTAPDSGDTVYIDYAYAFNISTLISNKQYSPLYQTTFDLMSDAQIKAQMDLWVIRGELPNDNLQSVGANKRVRGVGKNLFNYMLSSNGDLNNTTGAEIVYTARTRSGFIKAKPSTHYIQSLAGTASAAKLMCYDADYNFIGASVLTGSYWTTLSNTVYVRAVWTSVVLSDMQLELGSTATTYEAFKSNAMYFEGNAQMYSVKGATDVKDSIEYRNGKYYKIQRLGVDINNTVKGATWIESGTTGSTYHRYFIENLDNTLTNMKYPSLDSVAPIIYLQVDNDKYIIKSEDDIDTIAEIDANLFATTLNSTGNLYVVSNQTTAATFMSYLTNATNVTFIYQLATPVETEIIASGNLLGFPSETVYVEDVLPDVDIYSTKIDITNTSYIISTLDSIFKLNADGSETKLAVSSATVAGDGLSFTHTGLTAGDVVFFTYYYSNANNVLGLTTVTYYKADAVVVDSVTGTVYKVVPTVASGSLTWTLVAV